MEFWPKIVIWPRYFLLISRVIARKFWAALTAFSTLEVDSNDVASSSNAGDTYVGIDC